MLRLIESLVAISAIIITSRFAGRIPAMMATAVAAASAAIIMPPFASWQVENTTDVVTVVFQSIIGLAVAYRWSARNGAVGRDNPPPQLSATRSAEEGRFRAIPDVMGKIPIEALGELPNFSAVPPEKLEKILSDVMQLALANSSTHEIKVYTSRRPSVDLISLVAEYNSSPSLPHVRILGRSGSQCAIRIKGWPANCSATFFDNGFENIYQISIGKIGGL
jgi:hypothetical protein